MAGPDQRPVLGLMCKSGLWQSLVGSLWQRTLTQTLGLRVIRVAGSFLVMMHLPVSLTLRKRESLRDDIPDEFQSTTLSTSSSSIVQVGTLPHFLDQWKSITSNRFLLNMVKGHHFQLRAWSPLFCNFQLFNSKAGVAHQLIIQKEVQEFFSQRSH